MEKEVICPWCTEKTTPEIKLLEKEHGMVREVRCTKCGKILAGYRGEEGDFMKSIRKFENKLTGSNSAVSVDV